MDQSLPPGEGLPRQLRELADRIDIRHQFALRGPPEGSQRARKIAEANLVAYHPAVRVHPETGERALFVSLVSPAVPARSGASDTGAERRDPATAVARGHPHRVHRPVPLGPWYRLLGTTGPPPTWPSPTPVTSATTGCSTGSL